MRNLSLLELDRVSGGNRYWDSADVNSAMGDSEMDHAALTEIQAQAASKSLWFSSNALIKVERDLNKNGTIDETTYWRLDGSLVRFEGTAEAHQFWDANGESLDRSGYFACLGGGTAGFVGGVCAATPLDTYIYGGVGTPGLSLSGGYSADTHDKLTGFIVSGTHIGVEPGTFESPGMSAVFGASLSDGWTATQQALSAFRADVDRRAADLAQQFIDEYYPNTEPDPMSDQP